MTSSTTRSEALPPSASETSNSRKQGRARCHSWPMAARARSMLERGQFPKGVQPEGVAHQHHNPVARRPAALPLPPIARFFDCSSFDLTCSRCFSTRGLVGLRLRGRLAAELAPQPWRRERHRDGRAVAVRASVVRPPGGDRWRRSDWLERPSRAWRFWSVGERRAGTRTFFAVECVSCRSSEPR